MWDNHECISKKWTFDAVPLKGVNCGAYGGGAFAGTYRTHKQLPQPTGPDATGQPAVTVTETPLVVCVYVDFLRPSTTPTSEQPRIELPSEGMPVEPDTLSKHYPLGAITLVSVGVRFQV